MNKKSASSSPTEEATDVLNRLPSEMVDQIKSWMEQGAAIESELKKRELDFLYGESDSDLYSKIDMLSEFYSKESEASGPLANRIVQLRVRRDPRTRRWMVPDSAVPHGLTKKEILQTWSTYSKDRDALVAQGLSASALTEDLDEAQFFAYFSEDSGKRRLHVDALREANLPTDQAVLRARALLTAMYLHSSTSQDLGNFSPEWTAHYTSPLEGILEKEYEDDVRTFTEEDIKNAIPVSLEELASAEEIGGSTKGVEPIEEKDIEIIRAVLKAIDTKDHVIETMIAAIPHDEFDAAALSKRETNSPTSQISPVFSTSATAGEIAHRIKAQREARGWSQVELAQRMGKKSGSSVENLENPERSPSLVTIHEAMEALGITEL